MEKKTIALDFDDYSPLNHRLDIIRKLRDRYEDFKVTMFLVPWDIRFNHANGGTPISHIDYGEWRNITRHAVEDGWMQVAIHGLTHAPREFEDMDAKQAQARLTFAQKFLEDAKIEYIHMFKAPQWLLSSEAKKVIEDNGFTVMEDGYYNWNVKDDFPVELDNVIGHGHVQNVCDNGLEESLIRIMQIPPDYEWKFLSEVI